MPQALKGLSPLLQGLGHQLPLLDAQRSGAEMYGAPRLSFYELVKPNERALSRIVGDLFDPRGKHGQGPLFLNALLHILCHPRVGVRDVVRVDREVLTANRRLIDIVIETPTVLLGIENKPWAAQQPNQLADYHSELQKRVRKLEGRALVHDRPFVLLFLSDQKVGVELAGLVRLQYQAAPDKPLLHSVLSSVVSMIRAPRARAHVNDFIRYIDLEFGGGEVGKEGDEPYVEAVQAEFDNSLSNRKAIAVVMLAQSKLHRRILEEIGTFLLHEVKKINEDFVANEVGKMQDCLEIQWNYWTLSRPAWPAWPANCFIALESDKGNWSKIRVGVFAPDPNNQKVAAAGLGCEARPKLKNFTNKVSGGNQTAWWPWWQWATPSEWGAAGVARLLIESPTAEIALHAEMQELVKHIAQLVGAIEECLRDVSGEGSVEPAMSDTFRPK